MQFSLTSIYSSIYSLQIDVFLVPARPEDSAM